MHRKVQREFVVVQVSESAAACLGGLIASMHLDLRWIFAVLACAANGSAQTGKPPDLLPIIRETVAYQLDFLQHHSSPLLYQAHRVDAKEDTTRIIVETREGAIGRLVARGGRALAPAENAAEQERLRTLSSADMAKKKKGEQSGEKFGTELISAMPSAMLYSLAPGQPQLSQVGHPQLVLDYRPNPDFHPASTAQELLTGLQGRLWIDSSDHHLLRIEIHVIHNLNLAWGLLARVYSGGTLEYDQRDIGGGHYAYTSIVMDLTLRELMLRTVPYRSQLTATRHQVLAAIPSRQEAVRTLLAYPVSSLTSGQR